MIFGPLVMPRNHLAHFYLFSIEHFIWFQDMTQTFGPLGSLLEYFWESLVCVYFSHIMCHAVLYLLICFSLRLPTSRGPWPCLLHPDPLPWDIIPRFFCNVWKGKWGVGLGYSGSENKLLCGWSREMTNVLQFMGQSSTRIISEIYLPQGLPWQSSG